jgi:hypothetical protein
MMRSSGNLMTSNNRAIDFIKGLDSECVEEDAIADFIFIAENENKTQQKEAVEFVLRFIKPGPYIIKQLIESNIVRFSIDLQYSIKKYVNDCNYREAEKKSEEESVWKELALLLTCLGQGYF